MASYLSTYASKIYLCVKMREQKEFIPLQYNCIAFDTYEEADKFYDSNYDKNKVEYSTMMPVCKYVPSAFHPVILNYKLAKVFVNAHILSVRK